MRKSVANDYIKWPALEIYGIYILLREFHEEYGFVSKQDKLSKDGKPVKTLFIIDTKRIIKKPYLQLAQLVELYIPDDRILPALYLYLQHEHGRNIDFEFNPSQLLKQLRIADTVIYRQTTHRQEIVTFKQQLMPIADFIHTQLQRSTLLGFNHLGQAVYHSVFGRFIQQPDGDTLSRQTANQASANFLYAIKPNLNSHDLHDIDFAALQDCAYAYIRFNPTLQTKRGLAKFCLDIFTPFLKPIQYSSHYDIANVIINNLKHSIDHDDDHNLPIHYLNQFNQAILVEELRWLYEQSLSYHPLYLSENLLESAYRFCSSRASLQDYGQIKTERIILPAYLAYLLGHALYADMLSEQIDEELSVYCPCASNGAILLHALQICRKIYANEPDNKFSHALRQMNNFDSNATLYLSYDGFNEIRGLDDDNLADYSCGILPLGKSMFAQNLPFTDENHNYHINLSTIELDQQLAINCLKYRKPNGRTVLMGPVDNKDDLGVVTSKSVHFLQYLQAYYESVTVIDLEAHLFTQTSNNSPARLYVIGKQRIKPNALAELHQRTTHIQVGFRLPVIGSHIELFDMVVALKAIEQSRFNPLFISFSLAQRQQATDTLLTLGQDKSWLEQLLSPDKTQGFEETLPDAFAIAEPKKKRSKKRSNASQSTSQLDEQPKEHNAHKDNEGVVSTDTISVNPALPQEDEKSVADTHASQESVQNPTPTPTVEEQSSQQQADYHASENVSYTDADEHLLITMTDEIDEPQSEHQSLDNTDSQTAEHKATIESKATSQRKNTASGNGILEIFPKSPSKATKKTGDDSDKVSEETHDTKPAKSKLQKQESLPNEVQDKEPTVVADSIEDSDDDLAFMSSLIGEEEDLTAAHYDEDLSQFDSTDLEEASEQENEPKSTDELIEELEEKEFNVDISKEAVFNLSMLEDDDDDIVYDE